MRKTLLCLALLGLFGSSGCVEPGDERLGASGELCAADKDCRQELLCIRQLCRAPEEEPLLYNCAQLCDYLDECNIEASNTCQTQCDAVTQGWSNEDFNGLGRCIFAQSCEDLRVDGDDCFDL